MRKITRKTGIFAVLALLGVSQVRAQAPSTKNPSMDFFAEEAEVVYSATKNRQAAISAPACVVVIKESDLENQGYRTLSEILQAEAGIYAIDDRNYSYHWIRGVGISADYNNRILLLINGHRINENIYGSASLDHQFPVDVHMIKQIEVIKGPGSALHGNNAFFAVINVVTKDPSDASAAQLNLEGGSYGTGKVAAAGAVRTANGGALASAAGRVMQGQNHHYAEFESVNGGIAENSDEEKSGSAYAIAISRGLTFHAAYSSRRKEIPTGSFGTRFNNDPPSFSRDTRAFAEVKSESKLTERINLTARAYFDRYTFDGDYFYDNDPAPPAVARYWDEEINGWWGEELLARWSASNGRASFTLGQDYERTSKLRVKAGYDLPGSEPDGFSDSSDRYSVFAQSEFAPFRPLNLTAGLRYDRYGTFGGTLNPRLAAVLAVRESTRIKTVYGTAFRAPTPYERLYRTFGNKENLDLRPESIETFETHLIESLGTRSSASVGYFHSALADTIDSVVDPADGLTQSVNGSGIDSSGMEVAFRWSRSNRMSARAGYTYQNTRTRDGRRLANSPEHTGHLSVAFEPLSELVIGSNLMVIGERLATRGDRIGADALVGVSLSYRPGQGQARFYAAVFNIFNESFFQTSDEEHVQNVFRQNGRNFNAGIELHFGR